MCFNCDQRWSKQHKCGTRVFLMVTNNDDFSDFTGELETTASDLLDGVVSLEEATVQAVQLSLHALSGEQAADTFRLLGHISTDRFEYWLMGAVPTIS